MSRSAFRPQYVTTDSLLAAIDALVAKVDARIGNNDADHYLALIATAGDLHAFADAARNLRPVPMSIGGE